MIKKIMKVLVTLVFVCSFSLMMTSCATKQTSTTGGEGAQTTPTETSTTTGTDPTETSATTTGTGSTETTATATVTEEEAAKKRLESEIKVFETDHIYFEFNTDELQPEARANLTRKAKWLRDNPNYYLRIEGHCDERGTNEYNLALGERRANAAWKFLNALGIPGGRLTVISYGEERPADPGNTEEAWAQNRRDEFKLIK